MDGGAGGQEVIERLHDISNPAWAGLTNNPTRQSDNSFRDFHIGSTVLSK